MLNVFRSECSTNFRICRTGVTDRIAGRSPCKKKALKIIYSNSSYSQALSLANETTLSNRRELLFHKFETEMTDTRHHPLSVIIVLDVHRCTKN